MVGVDQNLAAHRNREAPSLGGTGPAPRAGEPARPRGRSIAWHLGAFCVLLLLPATLFFGVLLWQQVQAERTRIIERGLQLANDAGEAVEQDLASLIGTARLAASAPRLQAGEVDMSGLSARPIARSLGVDIVIREPDGRQVMNTRLPPDQPFPIRPLEVDAEIRETGQPAVSDLFRAAAAEQLSLAVVAPVLRPESREVIYFIDLMFPPERVRDTILKPPLPRGVVASVLDRKGRIIARSRAHEQFVGREAGHLTSAMSGIKGHFETKSLEGVPVLVYYTRLPAWGWTLAVGIEQTTLNAPLWRLLGQLLAVGAVLAFLSAILAYLFGRRITDSLWQLSESAAALRAGAPAVPVASPIREVNEVSEVLLSASDERKRAEERQALMVRELHHRVKNTLATVQAVVSSSARTAETIEAFREAVVERISSLARTHTLLVNNAWGGASLRAIFEAELAAYDDPEHRRIRLEGPDIHVPDDIALAIGMTVHELTTNAAKYGALSRPTGTLKVRWDAVAEDNRRTLELHWEERGGPAVSPPTRKGFGSTLVERVLRVQLGGEVKTDYAPEGLTIAIKAPLNGATPSA
jgi:two-component sensor histidine kinase